MFKRALLAASIGLIAATSHAETLLSEDFANIANLSTNGWVLTNNSASANPGRAAAGGWAQGFVDTYGMSQAGTPTAYIASDYQAVTGGDIAQWLITPTFATDKTVQVSFYAHAGSDPAFMDMLSWGFNTSGGINPGGFTMSQAVTIGSDQWQQYTVTLNGQGAGTFARFAIQYSGNFDTANYVAIDSLTVNAVPEPGTLALAGLGLLALAFTARRSRKHVSAIALAGAAVALPLAAQAANDAVDATVNSTDSQIVVRDAASGQLRAATGQEAKALTQLRTGHAQGQTLQLLQRRHATGAVGARLNDNFMSHSVVVRQPDGGLTEYCFSSAAEAEATVKAGKSATAAPEQSNPLPTE